MRFKDKIKYAFIQTIPVMCGYLFLGIAYGIVLKDAGYSKWWAAGISTFVYAGSAQFIMIPLMTAGTSVLTMAAAILFVNSRHIFYGLSFTESFAKLKARPYMIFSLTDETYSVLCGCRLHDPKEEMRATWPYIALLDHFYWVAGSFLGGLAGQLIPFDTEGIGFAMTALFIVILVDQVRADLHHSGISAAAGTAAALLCLFIFGKSAFLFPALALSCLAISVPAVKNRKKGSIFGKTDSKGGNENE